MPESHSNRTSSKPELAAKVAAKRKARDELVERMSRHPLDDSELAITHAEPSVLLSDVANGRLTALEVTAAFCRAAALAQVRSNCLPEICFDEANRRARWLDEQLRLTDKPIGSLHGLPISIKASRTALGGITALLKATLGQCAMSGLQATLGMR